MGHAAHNGSFRTRQIHRHRGHGRGVWLMAIAGLNLMLWSVLVALIARAI